ncbi:MAG: flagellar hook-length control protein FliK [Legionella sp.]|nr:flagellar hook-length control protein FliK [Legionella sp.]
MAVEMNKSPSIRLTPGQEIKLAKPVTELYVGQILKTVVVTALTNDQVLININGQNLNAKSSHHFTPGELLDVKVIANQSETVLEVQHKSPSLSLLQSALLHVLPRQAPATNMMHTLTQLMQSGNLSPALYQQIKMLLGTIIPLSQLTQHMTQAISQSGVFLESALLDWQRTKSSQSLHADFKGQCLKILASLIAEQKNSPPLPNNLMESRLLVQNDPLPLPGAIPQPLHKNSLFNLDELPIETLQHILREQVSQVLARITANQLNHLIHDNKEGFLLMLDIPIKTNEHIDVIPIMIKQHKAEPMQPSKWSVSFALSLSTLGDLQATVALNSNAIDIKINAERTQTVEILRDCHEELKSILEESGLNLGQFHLHTGLEQNHIDVANLRLLDIRI